MDYLFTPEQLAFKREVDQFLAETVTPELIEEVEEYERDPGFGPLVGEFQRKVDARGWRGLSWPVEYGGLGRSRLEEFLLIEAFSYYGLPHAGAGVAPALMEFGTEQQKKELIPGILHGTVKLALGYTEPNAGSDLASLQTRAVRDGDDYVINGQKIFTSGAHYATHVWLAVRTDPDAPKHRGISVLVIPIDTPGITIRPLWTQADTRTNQVFYENVRVPVTCRVGEENVGWAKMRDSLAQERLSLHPTGVYDRLLKQLVEVLQEPVHGVRRIDNGAIRQTLAELYVEIEALRMLNLKNAWLLDRGIIPGMESSMVKVWGSELGYRIYHAGMQMLGRYGQLRRGSKEVRLRGRLEKLYRACPPSRFAGGTNEIQRDIIARRGFDLPR
jgi:alkylation response protein AidB-like acyl-CoA dehydrogenase